MPFNINDFQANISSKNFSRTDHFEVIFTGFGNESYLTYRAKSVNLPGRTANILEYFELGPEFKLGSFSNYTDVSIDFICTQDLSEREYFLSWQDLIVGNHRNERKAGNLQQEYYKNYVKTIEIYIYNETSKKTKTVKLLEAFPTNIGDISYDWGTSEFATVNVTFAYRYFEDPTRVLIPDF